MNFGHDARVPACTNADRFRGNLLPGSANLFREETFIGGEIFCFHGFHRFRDITRSICYVWMSYREVEESDDKWRLRWIVCTSVEFEGTLSVGNISFTIFLHLFFFLIEMIRWMKGCIFSPKFVETGEIILNITIFY